MDYLKHSRRLGIDLFSEAEKTSEEKRTLDEHVEQEMHPTDYLQEMLDRQEVSQNERGYIFSEMSVHERVDYVKKMALYMQTEMCEFLQELPYFKEWKVYQEATEVLTPEGREELMDVVHFILNILLACGMDSKGIYNGYLRKQQINQERLKDKEHYRKDNEHENRSDAANNTGKAL